MRRSAFLITSFALLLLCSAVAAVPPVDVRGSASRQRAAPPTIVLGSLGSGTVAVAGDLKAKPFTLVRLKAEGADPKAAILWRVNPSAGVSKATSPRGVLEFVAPPGQYTVDLLVISAGPDGSLDVAETTVSVEIESCCDPKPPLPEPNPKPGKADPWNALGKIYFAPYGCTATIVGPRRPDGKWDVLTAGHCVAHVKVGATGSMQFRDGKRIAIKFVSIHGPYPAGEDLAWCETADAGLDLPFATLAAANPAVGTKIWHGGFGVDVPGNREEGTVAAGEDGRGRMTMNLSVSSGDSGGGIFRVDTGELVSAVCCTSSLGKRSSMYGGSTANILKTRPTAKAASFFTAPMIDVPPSGEWKPIAMPTVEPVYRWRLIDAPADRTRSEG